jgi:hypothetical protein
MSFDKSVKVQAINGVFDGDTQIDHGTGSRNTQLVLSQSRITFFRSVKLLE